MAKLRAILLLLLVLASALNSHARSTALKRGPECRVEKEVDKHLFQIYVTPPASTSSYTPGKIRIFLMRDYPDYMYVPLEQETLKDGRLHVQIAISPGMEEKYTVNILDQQKEELLLLHSEKLQDIPIAKKP